MCAVCLSEWLSRVSWDSKFIFTKLSSILLSTKSISIELATLEAAVNELPESYVSCEHAIIPTTSAILRYPLVALEDYLATPGSVL